MMQSAQPRRRRRKAGIATIIGGAIAAVLWNWMGFGAGHKTAPRQAPSSSASTSQEQNQSKPPAEREVAKFNFTFYTLALSLAPAFCETSPNKKQCSKLTAAADALTPLTLHGLWPENARPGSYPESCEGPNITAKALERDIDSGRLRRFMPRATNGVNTVHARA